MPVPDESEVIAYFDKLSNWGRWGKDDVLGTLNFITPEKRIAASQLVHHGKVVSCAWKISTAPTVEDMMPPQRFMLRTGEGLKEDAENRQQVTYEFLGMVYHGRSITHLDALAHQFWDRGLYNGVAAETVTAAEGATVLDIADVKEGIVTRGVLVDVPKYRGIDWLEPKERVTGDEIRAILEKEHVVTEEGDVLLLRTGYGKKVKRSGFEDTKVAGPAGWDSSCLPLFHELSFSAIGSDMNNDLRGSLYPAIPEPIHAVSLVAMGLRIIDNCDLEELAETCNELGTSVFEFIITPLAFIGATGSPVNPIAIF